MSLLTIKLQGECSINNTLISCRGYVEVLNLTGKNIYASWKMNKIDGEQIASVSRSYYIDKEVVSEYDVIPLVLDNITNYRSGRRRIFSNIDVLSGQ